jgi:hypothetical protein
MKVYSWSTPNASTLIPKNTNINPRITDPEPKRNGGKCCASRNDRKNVAMLKPKLRSDKEVLTQAISVRFDAAQVLSNAKMY